MVNQDKALQVLWFFFEQSRHILIKNYYNKQRDGTEAQIKYLYETKDVTFRGFRFSGGQVKENIPSESFEKRSKIVSDNSNEVKLNGDKKNYSTEGAKNWEGSMTGDGDRFSQQLQNLNDNKNKNSFETYLKRKKARAETRKAANKGPLNPNETSSLYTNWHGQTRS